MAVSQTILCTTVPNGFDVDDDVFQVSLVFSPRLRSDADTTLADFADWLDWPTTVAGMTFDVEFPDLSLTSTPTISSTPDSARWSALFPSNTLVRGFGYEGLDHRRLFSYPTRSLLGFFADRWGHFGGTDYDDHVLFDDLAASDGFDPVGFEQLGDLKETGPQRKARLLGQIEQAFDPSSDDPTKWALQPAVNPLSTADGTALEMLKWERFHRRGRSDRAPSLTPTTPTLYDFHEIVALSADFFHLPRMLGLVLDLTFPSTRVLFGAGSADTRVRVVPTWSPVLVNPPDPDSNPYTRCRVGGGDATHAPAFVAIPKSATSDYVDRWLDLGDATKFDVFDVDVDRGASQSRGFADNVSRSRRNQDQKYSFATPDRYALPHHSSAGLQVSRFDRATQSTTMFAGHLALNAQLVDSNGDPNPGPPPDLFLDDLVRGIRLDVKHSATFLSLMRRTGQYHFLNQGAAGDVDIDEEGVVSGGVTSAGGTDGDANDIYQGETLVRWKGWSLANHLIGQAVGPDDQPSDGVEDQSNAPFLSTFTVPPGTLPRLRFGQSYQLRARAVDLAGNSPAPEDTEPAGAASPAVTYRRYEPVPSPVVVYRDVPAAPDDPGLHNGDTAEVFVIRSENGASLDSDAGASRRHLLPPKVAQSFAELHGVLDTGAGGAVDKTVYDHVAALDAGDLANHPDGVDDPTTPGSKAFPVDHLDLNYLPDPLARAAVLRDLPPSGALATTTTSMRMYLGGWPDYDTWRVDLVGGPVSQWAIDNTARVLTITLAKADVFEPRASTALFSADLDLMGVWAWIIAMNSPVPTALQRAAQSGSHWMLSPWRQLKVIHAVRTPLADPDLPDGSFLAEKQHIGDTFALLQRQLIFHRKSTGRVDVIGAWQMKIDTGPGGADPTVPHDFQAVAGSLTLDRAKPDPVMPGEELFAIDHEFGDTKYRLVDYHPVATSAFVELFRQTTTVTPSGTDPVLVDARGIEAPTVKVTDPLTDLVFTQARPGMPATGDYLVDEVAGTIERTALSTMADGQPVGVSYVAQEVNTYGADRTRVIKSSARPAAPKVKWALPTFTWSGTGSSGDPHTKHGGNVRLYLDRPWWSSGDDEQLAVLCWPLPPGQTPQMPKDYEPYATQWGTDPVHLSADAQGYPVPADFTLAAGYPSLPATLPFPELGGQPVAIAPHDVAFDAERDLWYCDINVFLGEAGLSYNPFVRLAVARYQANSLATVALSPVVLADFVQLGNDRALSMVAPTRDTRTVTLAGPTSVATDGGGPNQVRFRVEVQAAGISDPDLGWTTLSARTGRTTVLQDRTVDPTIVNSNQAFWTTELTVATTGRCRIIAEEIESFYDGFTASSQIGPVLTTGGRIVHVDTLPVSAPPS